MGCGWKTTRLSRMASRSAGGSNLLGLDVDLIPFLTPRANRIELSGTCLSSPSAAGGGGGLDRLKISLASFWTHSTMVWTIQPDGAIDFSIGSLDDTGLSFSWGAN